VVYLLAMTRDDLLEVESEGFGRLLDRKRADLTLDASRLHSAGEGVLQHVDSRVVA
jgi:hypothetical protein